jgi:transcriptional regulator with XRE-family HTH domain
MPKVSPGDPALLIRFGINAREQRRVRGWSIEMLAKRAGVAPHTVLRIEHGKPSTPAKRARIAAALDTVSARLEAEPEVLRDDVAVHSHRDDRWMSLIDYRSNKPEDDLERIQEPDERRRLGELGFVPQFVRVLHCRLPKGKLVAGVLELHGPLIPSRYLGGEIFAYGLRGDSVLQRGEERFPLNEGQSLTFDCTAPFHFAPKDGEGPSLVLYVRLDEIEPIRERKPKRGARVDGVYEEWAASGSDIPPKSRALKRGNKQSREGP